MNIIKNKNLSAMNKSILYLFIIHSLFACNNDKKSTLSSEQDYLKIRDFNSQSWKGDSLGCLSYREKSYNTLLISKAKLLNSTIQSIETLLGNPNRSKLTEAETKYFYFIIPGPQCKESLFKEENLRELSMLYVYFNDQKKVNRIGIMVP